MRVLFTKGRLEPVAQKRIMKAVAPGRRVRPPKYFYSSIFHDLEPACKAKGWTVETLLVGSEKRQRLNVPDVIVNLISEPLLCSRALVRLDVFVKEHGKPILNSVEATCRSSREALSGLFSGRSHPAPLNVHAPLTTRFSGLIGELETHITSAGHKWPVIVRPPGLHGGRGMQRLDSPEAVTNLTESPTDLLVTDFADYRWSDGWYRKYRMIWVDGTLFRRHLITAKHWNVGGESREDMVERPDLIEAEKAYLAAGEDALEKRVAELFRIVGLDFGLIDFSVSESGEITVFELNGSFQLGGSIPEEFAKIWGYLEAANAPILDALLAAISRRR